MSDWADSWTHCIYFFPHNFTHSPIFSSLYKHLLSFFSPLFKIKTFFHQEHISNFIIFLQEFKNTNYENLDQTPITTVPRPLIAPPHRVNHQPPLPAAAPTTVTTASSAIFGRHSPPFPIVIGAISPSRRRNSSSYHLSIFAHCLLFDFGYLLIPWLLSLIKNL